MHVVKKFFTNAIVPTIETILTILKGTFYVNYLLTISRFWTNF